MSDMSVRIKKIHGSWFIVRSVSFLLLLSALCFLPYDCYAAPCYGTKLPERNKFFTGLENNNIFKRNLENDYGKVKSAQYFLLLSYGIFDWLSIDLKGGAGNINQQTSDGNHIRYATGFAGGYGLRLKFFDNNKIRGVLGFQHISVHPASKDVDNVKNKAILDDWQVSLLGSYDIWKFSPYLGTKWSRTDYIHKIESSRKRQMSDMTQDIGLIVGTNINLTNQIWINLEGQFFDVQAAAASLNYSF